MLNNILRVLQITRLFIKYDVDKMLVNCGSGKCKFYFYMLPWNWFRRRHVDNIPLKIRMMFEELGPIFVKLGQVISTRKDLLTDADGTGQLTSVPSVLGKQIARIENYGISNHPESFVAWGENKYFTDAKRSAVI